MAEETSARQSTFESFRNGNLCVIPPPTVNSERSTNRRRVLRTGRSYVGPSATRTWSSDERLYIARRLSVWSSKGRHPVLTRPPRSVSADERLTSKSFRTSSWPSAPKLWYWVEW